MGTTTDIPRRALPPAILLGLVIGAAAGLAAGWFVWPVTWYDTDPSDLRLRHQIAYVALTADAYDVTGDLTTARERLYELVDEDTTWAQVANLVVRVGVAMENEGDGAAAQRVRRLYYDVGMPSPAEEEFVLGPRQRSQPGLWIGLGALAVVGLAAVVWLVGASHTAAREEQALAPQEGYGYTGSAPAEPMTPLVSGDDAEPVTEQPQQQDSTTAPSVPVGLDEEDWQEVISTIAPEEPTASAQLQPDEAAELGEAAEGGRDEEETPPDDDGSGEADDELWEEDEEGPQPVAVEGHAEGPTAGQAGLEVAAEGEAASGVEPLGSFEAEYRFGDRDFDCSFSIESESGAFLGECGVGVADVLSANDTRHVEAFEVWLFDKTDIRTVSAVLVSEDGRHDEALLERLRDKGDLLVARPGLVVRLQTLSLRVTATVRSCAYAAEGGEVGTCFEHLSVALLAERTGELS